MLLTFPLATLVSILTIGAITNTVSADPEVLIKCPANCTIYGTCNGDTARCECPKDRMGDDCSQIADEATLKSRCLRTLYLNTNDCIHFDLSCMNNCNKRGTCISGWCHCKPGYYGVDCSLSLGPDGKPVLLAGSNYTTRSKRPWVYVYELPPELLGWQNTKRLDRSTHLHFYQRMLSSGARIADGDLADWYFIPVRQRTAKDSVALGDAIAYVRDNYPWWNRTGGGYRHFIIHTSDLGAGEVYPEFFPLSENVTWLTHWGLTADKNFSGWRKAHRLEKDVVIPVFLSVGLIKRFGVDRTPLHPLMEKQERNTTFFFAGRICGDRQPPRKGEWPNCGPFSPGYSLGVRQLVHYHHWNRTGFRVVTFDKDYGGRLRSSKFCLAPLGGGHGQRQIIVSYMGCVPVSIADDVYEPYEPQTSWKAFAVRPAEADIPRLHEILGAITPEQFAEMQVALRCAAQHMAYSSVTGSLFGEDGRFDAFETTLEILRVKAAHPDAPPEQYRQLDADFDHFMDCKDPPGWKVSGPVPDLWGLLPGNATGGSTGAGGRGGNPPQQQWENPLCSHSVMERSRYHCDPVIMGSSKTHGIPGGVICAKTRPHLDRCPRIWL